MGNAAKITENAKHWLVDAQTGKTFALFDGFQVGRADCDLQILSPSISSIHCKFHLQDNILEIEDLGSRNGTFVDGNRLEPNIRVALSASVQVTIGDRVFGVKAGPKPKDRATAVELASFSSQLAPDSIPAPSPAYWSTAVVPGQRRNGPKSQTRTIPGIPRPSSESGSRWLRHLLLLFAAVCGASYFYFHYFR